MTLQCLFESPYIYYYFASNNYSVIIVSVGVFIRNIEYIHFFITFYFYSLSPFFISVLLSTSVIIVSGISSTVSSANNEVPDISVQRNESYKGDYVLNFILCFIFGKN